MRRKLVTATGLALAGLLIAGAALGAQDWGLFIENQTRAHSNQLFGIKKPLERSSTQQVTAAEATADPTRLVTLASGLKAEVVTSSAGANTDMMALWPNDTEPTHLITCNEQGTTNPGVQRIDIATGAVETIVTGTQSCDGARRTAWGTIMFSEEAGGGPNGGRVYELIDPLHTTNVQLNRQTGVFAGGTNPQNLTARPALGRLSFEGFAIYPSGVTYYGDENRPSTGKPGGAYFKFVPSSPRHPAAGDVTALAQSPFAAGSVYGLRLGRRSGSRDYGQGTELGFGTWISVCPNCNDGDLRALGQALFLTGYYRPEDIDIDHAAEVDGKVRFCGNNTGNESDDQLWGETICVTDGSISGAPSNTAKPEVQRLVDGSPEYAMPDNIAYQPGRGNWIVHEDADTDYAGNPAYLGPHNNDLWDCLDDGGDSDLQSDACVRIATLNDLTAEWTGGIFDATAERFFVSVQHNVTGTGIVLEITGWR